uniref:Zinc finger protein 653-like n=1 Tax=Sinocyclocheilus anshuiensis TaxID=1608454 RepID=A0A671S1M6_9TELE
MAAVNTDSKATGEHIKAILRRCRGRPRLTDADRAQRRLESRKKYDVRRVYLGEAHQVWSELRRRTSLSDAGLAEYLILLNSKVSATSLQTVVSWYQGHCQSCQHEPELQVVEPTVGLSTSALWQCVAGHSFVQYLPWPAGGESESDVEDGVMEKDEEDRPPEKKSTVSESINTKSKKPQNHRQLQGRKLIIITGPSYEALASEGIQLNVAGSDVEEVTCTLIGDVSYNQMCQSRPSAGTVRSCSSTSYISDKLCSFEFHIHQRIQKNNIYHDFHKNNIKCFLSIKIKFLKDLEVTHGVCLCVRCKRSRRGPVIEADGMLKMFHCPYEGCSQVYVAISSFQNHVNLVHRKGRTKVCPHPGCGKKFYLSNHLHRHMIIHSGVRDFICETCGKSFKRKNHLEVHRRGSPVKIAFRGFLVGGVDNINISFSLSRFNSKSTVIFHIHEAILNAYVYM